MTAQVDAACSKPWCHGLCATHVHSGAFRHPRVLCIIESGVYVVQDRRAKGTLDRHFGGAHVLTGS